MIAKEKAKTIAAWCIKWPGWAVAIAVLVLCMLGVIGCESAYFGKTATRPGESAITKDAFDAMKENVGTLQSDYRRLSEQVAEGFTEYNNGLAELSRQLDTRLASKAQTGIDSIDTKITEMASDQKTANAETVRDAKMKNGTVGILGGSAGLIGALSMVLIVLRFVKTGKLPGENGSAA